MKPTLTQNVRQLLNQTSGLPNYFVIFGAKMSANPEKIFTNSDILQVLKRKTNRFQLSRVHLLTSPHICLGDWH